MLFILQLSIKRQDSSPQICYDSRFQTAGMPCELTEYMRTGTVNSRAIPLKSYCINITDTPESTIQTDYSRNLASTSTSTSAVDSVDGQIQETFFSNENGSSNTSLVNGPSNISRSLHNNGQAFSASEDVTRTMGYIDYDSLTEVSLRDESDNPCEINLIPTNINSSIHNTGRSNESQKSSNEKSTYIDLSSVNRSYLETSIVTAQSSTPDKSKLRHGLFFGLFSWATNQEPLPRDEVQIVSYRSSNTAPVTQLTYPKYGVSKHAISFSNLIRKYILSNSGEIPTKRFDSVKKSTENINIDSDHTYILGLPVPWEDASIRDAPRIELNWGTDLHDTHEASLLDESLSPRKNKSIDYGKIDGISSRRIVSVSTRVNSPKHRYSSNKVNIEMKTVSFISKELDSILELNEEHDEIDGHSDEQIDAITRQQNSDKDISSGERSKFESCIDIANCDTDSKMCTYVSNLKDMTLLENSDGDSNGNDGEECFSDNSGTDIEAKGTATKENDSIINTLRSKSDNESSTSLKPTDLDSIEINADIPVQNDHFVIELCRLPQNGRQNVCARSESLPDLLPCDNQVNASKNEKTKILKCKSYIETHFPIVPVKFYTVPESKGESCTPNDILDNGEEINDCLTFNGDGVHNNSEIIYEKEELKNINSKYLPDKNMIIWV